MIRGTDVSALAGARVIDSEGARIGTVGQVVLSDDGDQPLFVTVRTARSGAAESYVPLQSAEFEGNTLQVAFDRETIRSAPDLDPAGRITDDEQGTLFDYYDAVAGGAPSGVDGTPAGVVDTPEERTVGVARPESRSEGRGATPLGGGSEAERPDS